MTLEMIKTFITLAETRSFSRTADILFVSQPTVSVRLKAMEDELKFPLFVRSNKQVELTPMGLQFFPYAMQMFRSMAACQDFIRGYESQMKRLTISAPVTCWDFGPLRQTVLDFCQKTPDMILDLLRNDSASTYRSMVENAVDLGVVYSTPLNPDVEYVPYFQEELYLVASPKMHLPPQGDFLYSGEKPPLIRPAYAGIASQLVEESLYMLPSRIASDHPSLYLDLVKSGMGIGLLQSTIIEEELKNGTLEMIDCTYNSHPILYKNYLAYFKRKKQNLAPLIDSLLAQ